MKMIWLSLIASGLFGQAFGQPWQSELARMPLQPAAGELNRTNCVSLMLHSFQKSSAVKALVFMPGATDELNLFRRVHAKITATAPTLLDAVTALTNQTLIRATFKAEDVARLDEAEGVLRQPSGQILAELLAAQEERASANRELDAVAADIAAIEQAQADRQAAAELRERATKARAAMAKGATLADLKTLLAG